MSTVVITFWANQENWFGKPHMEFLQVPDGTMTSLIRDASALAGGAQSCEWGSLEDPLFDRILTPPTNVCIWQPSDGFASLPGDDGQNYFISKGSEYWKK